MDTTKICEKLYRHALHCLILETNASIDTCIYKLQTRRNENKMKQNICI